MSQLRADWLPLAETFSEPERRAGVCARMYRAFSWLERVEELEAAEGAASIDDQLILSWTALNSLYGRWDATRGEPEPDIRSLEAFGNRLLAIDRDQLLSRFIEDQRSPILEVFNSQFLARRFWCDPAPGKLELKTTLWRKATHWYLEQAYGLLLERLLRTIYYQRCLLIHGAAKRGSSFNRDTVGACLGLLRMLLPAVLRIIIEHGAGEDWGAICYPALA